MRRLALIFGLLLGLSLCLFFGISGTKAAESLYYEQTINDGFVSDGGAQTTQTFTASSTNITKIELTYETQASANTACFAICEVPAVNTSDSNYLSIGTPMINYCSDTPVNPDSASFDGSTATYTFETPYQTTVGHYYMFIQNIAGCGGHVLPRYGATGNFFGGTWCYGGSCEKHNGGDLVFKAYSNPAPTVSGTVYWAGVGTQYGQIGGIWDIPFYWNVCSSYGSIRDLFAAPVIDGTEMGSSTQLLYDIIGPQQCQDFTNWSGAVQETTAATGTMYIRLFTTADGTIATSSPFNYSINSGGNSGNYISPIVQNPFYINQSTGTTTINFAYDFTGLAYSGGKVCIYDADRHNNTNYCSNTISAVSGYSSVDIPNSSNYLINSKLVLYSASDTPIFSSNGLMIVWYSAYTSDISTSTIPNFMPLNTHDMACTDEEWNEGDGWTFFNFTKLKCRTIKTGLDIANLMNQMIQGFLNAAVNGVLINMFPLNVPLQMRNSWIASETTALPSELSWIEMSDESGNVNLYMPAEWSGGSTTTIPVWGPAIFESNNQVKNLFAGVRALSTYTIWVLIILYVIRVGMALYEEFIKPKTANFGLMDINMQKKNFNFHWHALDDDD